MDRSFVEEVTRLVIAKLNETQSYPPLSEEEINTWKQISLKNTTTIFPEAVQLKPLTEAEIATWKDISSKLNSTIPKKNGYRQKVDKVKFYSQL